jgi:hypothetical protein
VLAFTEALGLRKDRARGRRHPGAIGEVRLLRGERPAGYAGSLQDLPRLIHGRDATIDGMEEPVLSKERIQRLMEAAGEQLTGDWVLVGGALAALWFAADRVTVDVDLISLPDRPERRYELMDFALAQGLPLEAVNSAADFFLRRIPGWVDDLEILHAGARARIFRPTPTLFLILKCGRMSEADLSDCLGLLALAQRTGMSMDRARVLAHLAGLPVPESEDALTRRETLREALAVDPR